MTEDQKLDNINFCHKHLWSYFELHAKQRTDLFRYYVVFFSLFITATSFLSIRFSYDRIGHEIAAIFLALAFAVITAVFQQLDFTNRKLIHSVEESFRDLESGELFFNDKFKIFKIDKEKKESGDSGIGYTNCFRIIFVLGYFLSAVLILCAIIAMCYYSFCK